MVKKLSYLLLASATAVSFSAIAAGNQKQSSPGQSDQTQAQSSQSPDVVKQAQEKLSAAGMNAGQADGKLGPKTQSAVKEFQQSKGIQGSGKLDQQTLAALGVSESSGSASTGSTSSSSGASSSSPSSASSPSTSASSPSASSGASSPSSSSERTAEPKSQGGGAAGPAAGDSSSGSTGSSGKSSKY
jgi:peptidoglycan hydrolase-like protein with peptidoglycan-binding domain